MANLIVYLIIENKITLKVNEVFVNTENGDRKECQRRMEKGGAGKGERWAHLPVAFDDKINRLATTGLIK